jgi:hypothetical protein
MDDELTFVASDDVLTRRERRRQSEYRQHVLGLPAGKRSPGRELGNYLRAEDWRSNFLSAEAADYAALRADQVQRENGQLQKARLFTNMLSSMPLCFSVFGHLRAHAQAAVAVLGDLLELDLVALDEVDVRGRTIHGIECEWAPDRREHLDDRSAFDAVVAARRRDGRTQLVAVETKYVDSFSRDPANDEADQKYDGFCQEFGMADGAFERLRGHGTRQLLRNVLLTESVRRGGASGGPTFDDAVTLVLARDDDRSAMAAVETVRGQQGRMATDVRFAGHGALAQAASRIDELQDWADRFRGRYLDGSGR